MTHQKWCIVQLNKVNSFLKTLLNSVNPLNLLINCKLFFTHFLTFFHSYFCCFILPRQKRPSNFLTLNKVLFFNTFLDVVKHPFHLKRSTLSSDRFSKIYCMLRTLLLYSAFLLLAFLKSIHKQDLLYMKTDAY